MTVTRKKLIEVALPLDAINAASAREKSIRHGHPSTLHLWWARRPLAAARAVIFAQMVDDPSTYVDTLLRDPALERRAKRELKDRQALWQRRQEAYAAAQAKGDATAHAPGEPPTLEECAADLERERLFDIIRALVEWENTTNEAVLQAARDEIWQSWRRACADNADHPRAGELFRRDKLPAFHDPFAGGGALPLEAQRLGLDAHASDLNPVAVLINKAMIEIPPKFAGRPPVNPASRKQTAHGGSWRGVQGLAEDVRYYGQWIRDEAEKRIGNLYPKVHVTAAMAKHRSDLKPYQGRELTVIAWLWARTVKSPNPAFAAVDVPLVSTYMLSTKAGKEAYIAPVVEGAQYRFAVKVGKPDDQETAKNGTKLARGANFACLVSGTPIDGDYIKAEGKAGRMGVRLMAIVAEGDRGRVYIEPTVEQEELALKGVPEWKPELTISGSSQYLGVKPYGMDRFDQLFTVRQLVALTTFSDLVGAAADQLRHDALLAGLPDDTAPLADDGLGAKAYGEAVATFLSFGVSKSADYWSNLCIWRSDPKNLGVGHVFARQALAMTWDFAEGNPFSNSSGNISVSLDWIARVISELPAIGRGSAEQVDAQNQMLGLAKVVSTDPPYYDNVPYADLSDFFYIWLRRSLRGVFPALFSTVAVPKVEELVAFAYRHKDGKSGAEAFFLDGMTRAMRRLSEQSHPAFPVTIYYAFKQAESDSGLGTASTGWETFLDAVVRAGLGVSGTWPTRTELANRTRSMGSNALATSIVLVCRPRHANAPIATRRQFVAALKAELPLALTHLQRGNIAPVDLAQAAIGPGMAVFTRYAKVLGAEDQAMSVREALALINQTLDEALAEQEGDFDADSRWAITWFDENGFADGDYGRAEQLSKSKNTSVEGMKEAGILASARGKVRLLKPAELPTNWDPATDTRLSAWETVHHLVRALESGGDAAAAKLVAALGARAEVARELAYRLYQLCERRKRPAEAMAYNALVLSWPEIVRLASDAGGNGSQAPVPADAGLFDE
jgi:putative DNA methylase